jgi:hypothetical protein
MIGIVALAIAACVWAYAYGQVGVTDCAVSEALDVTFIPY